MDQIRLYFRSCGMLMKCQMQYRASFLMQMFSQFVMIGTELLAVILLIDRFTVLGQWSAGEILFFFGQTNIAFYICEAFCRGITSFPPLVQKGELDTMLIRPRGILFQVLCSQADPRRFGAILIGLAALMMGAFAAKVQFDLVKIVLLIWSIAGTVALAAGLFLIEATFSFFSVKSIEMVNVLTYGGRSTCQYPIDLYPRGMQLLFTMLAPFALSVHVPVSYILDKPLWNASALGAFAAPFSGFAFLFVMTLVFYRGLKHYRSTGS